ncbi:hypothetical protein HDU76_011314, partial [Blyttiomyces sp. JEL0837]
MTTTGGSNSGSPMFVSTATQQQHLMQLQSTPSLVTSIASALFIVILSQVLVWRFQVKQHQQQAPPSPLLTASSLNPHNPKDEEKEDHTHTSNKYLHPSTATKVTFASSPTTTSPISSPKHSRSSTVSATSTTTLSRSPSSDSINNMNEDTILEHLLPKPPSSATRTFRKALSCYSRSCQVGQICYSPTCQLNEQKWRNNINNNVVASVGNGSEAIHAAENHEVNGHDDTSTTPTTPTTATGSRNVVMNQRNLVGHIRCKVPENKKLRRTMSFSSQVLTKGVFGVENPPTN